jgi:hypothetical protein
MNCTNGLSEWPGYSFPKFTDGATEWTYPDDNKETPPILGSLWSKACAGSLERLDPSECIDQYATSIQSNRRNVLLVANDSDVPVLEENRFINACHIYRAAEIVVDSLAKHLLDSHRFYDGTGKPGTGIGPTALNYKTPGYSPLAILSVIILGVLIVMSIIGTGYTPYKRRMTLSGSSSMALSAACHSIERGEDEESIAGLKLQLGVVMVTIR